MKEAGFWPIRMDLVYRQSLVLLSKLCCTSSQATTIYVSCIDPSEERTARSLAGDVASSDTKPDTPISDEPERWVTA
jgi:hypothetical protein